MMSSINTSPDDILMTNNRKKFGILWFVLNLIGIDVSESSSEGISYNPLILLKRGWFFLLLIASFCFLEGYTLSTTEFGYVSFIDLILSFIPIILWVLMYRRKRDLKNLINQLHSVTENVKLPRYFTLVINLSISLTALILIALILTALFYRGNELVSVEIYYRYAHEMICPSLVAITYVSMCYIFVKGLQETKKEFEFASSTTDLQSIPPIIKNYLELMKGLKMFQDLFSTPVFLFLFMEFGVVMIHVLDFLMMNVEYYYSMLPEVVIYMPYVICLVGVLTLMAAQVLYEMKDIKTAIIELMSAKTFGSDEKSTRKELSLLLKRDIFFLSACNTFALDRMFLPKGVVTIIVLVVIIFQVEFTRMQNDLNLTENSTEPVL